MRNPELPPPSLSLVSWHPREDDTCPVSHPYSRVVWVSDWENVKVYVCLYIGRN